MSSIPEDYDLFDELNSIFNTPSELSMILEEIKTLRIENQEIKKDNVEIKEKLDCILKALKSNDSSKTHDSDIDKSRSEIPIESEINGEWKLVKSKDVEEFLDSQRDIFPFEASRIRYSNICFELKNLSQLKTCNQMNGRLNLETHFFGLPNNEGIVFSIEDNKLMSIQKFLGGEVFSVIERFIENGKLRIIWERNGYICERIYEKLDNWSSETNPFDNVD